MNEADVIAALRAYWIASAGALPYIWEDDTDPMPNPVWTRVTFRSASNNRPAVGRTREENRGVIMVQIFGERKFGPGAVERAGSTVSGIWRAYRHSFIRLAAPSSATLPTEGAFINQLVTVDWRADLRFNA